MGSWLGGLSSHHLLLIGVAEERTATECVSYSCVVPNLYSMVVDARMRVVQWCSDTDWKNEVLGEKYITVKLCPHKFHKDWSGIESRPVQ
jgi:hypothetical protein